MENVLIPRAVLNSREFARLQPKVKVFLIQLYAMYSDVERFTIDLRDPKKYGLTPGVYITNRVTPLTQCGLLMLEPDRDEENRRVFRFRYSQIGELRRAA